jgi:predicted membrane protein
MTSAGLVLMNVLLMRWNVVIGGQEISKTGKGLLTYPMTLFGHESFVSASILLIAPFILLWVLVRLFPPWAERSGSER